MTLNELTNKINEVQKSTQSLRGKSELLIEQLDKLSQSIAEKEIFIVDCKAAVEVLRQVQESSQQIIQEAFEEPVSNGLKFIFGDGHALVLEYKEHGNKMHLIPKIITPKNPEPTNPLDTESGGKIDITNLLLRIMILEMINPRMDCTLLLDEPFKHVRGNSLLDKAHEFLLKLQQKTQRQLILSTPQANFRGQEFHVIKLGSEDGDSE